MVREDLGLVCWLLRGERVEEAEEKDWDEEKDYGRVMVGRLG
jgi:hypothetical protein